MTTMTTPAPASTPTRAPLGWWIIAGTDLGQPYPCRCSPPCRSKGERTCPCTGRTDLHPGLPETCCAVLAALSTAWRATTLTVNEAPPAGPVPSRWAAPARSWAAPADYLGPDVRRPPRWAAPINPDVQHEWTWPIRVLEHRLSRRPGPGESDCEICGELLAEQLFRQGYVVHIGC